MARITYDPSVNSRISTVCDLIIANKWNDAVGEKLRAHWGVSKQQCETYVSVAHRYIHLSLGTPDEIKSAILAKLTLICDAALTDGKHHHAIQALELYSRICGLITERKISGVVSYQALSDQELASRFQELRQLNQQTVDQPAIEASSVAENKN